MTVAGKKNEILVRTINKGEKKITKVYGKDTKKCITTCIRLTRTTRYSELTWQRNKRKSKELQIVEHTII